MNSNPIYVLGDGDKIRDKVEQLLFQYDLEALAKFSESLTNAIQQVKEIAIITMDAHIILAGGDDILFYVSREKYHKKFIQQMQEDFYKKTGNTISFGIGKTIEMIYINLHKAKISKDLKIIEEEQL